MNTATISSKFQVAIPKKMRESLNIRAGQKVVMLEYDGRIEMLLVPSIKEARGMFPGLDTTVERERDDRV